MPTGRFAPSPTGRLHLGNLRTALAAWLFARHDGSRFRLRFDDLDGDAIRPQHYRTQVDDLAAIGLDWDGEPMRQSERLERYRSALATLEAAELVYPCYCSRREIREAAQAPNNPLAGHDYPGTCRQLSSIQRARQERTGRPPALRLRAEGAQVAFDDVVAGPCRYPVDDFVVRRNDGIPAYHLVTVVDDAEQGVELVVRGDDLLPSTSRQLLIGRLLGLPSPAHAHLPLVLGLDGQRLAKRHGAVTLDDQARLGRPPPVVLSRLAHSLGLASPGEPVEPADLLSRFEPARLPRSPLVLGPDDLDRP